MQVNGNHIDTFPVSCDRSVICVTQYKCIHVRHDDSQLLRKYPSDENCIDKDDSSRLPKGISPPQRIFPTASWVLNI